MERFVNARGREIIGWDEILQGGLAPNAKVMSWLGEEGGIEAARQRHEAVMAPHSRYYLGLLPGRSRDRGDLHGRSGHAAHDV